MEDGTAFVDYRLPTRGARWLSSLLLVLILILVSPYCWFLFSCLAVILPRFCCAHPLTPISSIRFKRQGHFDEMRKVLMQSFQRGVSTDVQNCRAIGNWEVGTWTRRCGCRYPTWETDMVPVQR